MNIYIYGDSNTWGYVPNINGYSKNAISKQYPQELIWWNCLTKQHNIIVNGLCGRAINNDNPWLEGRNANKTIEQDLKGINNKIDLCIIQLGTNDCKSAYNLTADKITQNMKNLIIKIKNKLNCEILLISPAIIKSGNKITDKYYVGAEKKSVELNDKYYNLSKQLNIDFISGIYAEVGEDGEHLTINGHKYLSEKINKKITEKLENKEK